MPKKLSSKNKREYRSLYPALVKIDDMHVLKASCRDIFPCYVCVMTIYTGTWTMTEKPGFEFDSNKEHWNSLAKINDVE